MVLELKYYSLCFSAHSSNLMDRHAARAQLPIKSLLRHGLMSGQNRPNRVFIVMSGIPQEATRTADIAGQQ
jgi:hypothetical protein